MEFVELYLEKLEKELKFVLLYEFKELKEFNELVFILF